MNQLILKRKETITYKGVKGIKGELHINGKKWYTMENAERRITEGRYKLKYREMGWMFTCYNDKRKHPDLASVHNGRGMIEIVVPNRFALLFHIANFPEELEGCVGLGKEDKGNWVKDSKIAYIEFVKEVFPVLDKNEELYIKIIKEY